MAIVYEKTFGFDHNKIYMIDHQRLKLNLIVCKLVTYIKFSVTGDMWSICSTFLSS